MRQLKKKPKASVFYCGLIKHWSLLVYVTINWKEKKQKKISG